MSGGLIVGASLLLATHGLGGAALPIARARKRDRIADALRDLGKMRLRGCWIVEEPQRDPAAGELVLDPVVFPARNSRVARDLISGLGVIVVEQLAGNQPALDPPLVGVDRGRGVARDGEDKRCCLGGPVGAPQPLRAA